MWTDCPPGSYRARMMVDGQTYSSTFATEAEAAEWLVVTRGRVVAARAAQSLTVEDYACRWLGEFIDAAAGIDRYRRDVGAHILPALGSRPLVEVTPTEICLLLEHVGAAASATAAEQLRVALGGNCSPMRWRRESSAGVRCRPRGGEPS